MQPDTRKPLAREFLPAMAAYALVLTASAFALRAVESSALRAAYLLPYTACKLVAARRYR
ncbi:hypothetical protein QFW77_06270 [Luteimonas sp. RD2P54]|uniref:Uncharacterized protein n=1 Tax=Luteimonas endophytica TaxID=3042023 RepID=A0ABT6J6Z0_9GAMM|nr:hypothetical protein [Luteimonas endophytica]MDH5822596.1 hypothetical protein [Luteimonas endophytica]